ncbi:tyrocidine synthase 3 [Brevibacillus laterosporus GI-9]|uniref:non-ribosomal peptide synthetase n=1 Tax=Brevibacillus laterosporus TaxID=1465 RepID=UPI0002405093|nr:non-ribosomal peptide synthetase [Brevibacillus laterosporus]CCF15397.1 tyrocidine synthase 3 [Brevibacillus laterosporus GI-9]
MDNKLDKKNIEEIMGLTSTQEGMLFHYRNDLNSREYHEQLSLTLVGDIQVEILQKSWDFVIETNEMLRTIYRWKNIDNPVQIVLKNHKVKINYIDNTLLEDTRRVQEWNKIKESDLQNRIDITKETIRITLCKVADQKFEMMISNHHILYDGWSNAIILEELLSAYNCYYKGETPTQRQKTKFKTFLAEMNKVNQQERRQFWNQYLSGYEASNDYFSSNNKNKKQNKYNYMIPGHLSDKMKLFARDNKVSQASILYTAWSFILQMLNNSTDIVFGTVISGRNIQVENIDNMVGLFINTIPLRIQIDDQERVVDLIKKVDHSLKERMAYENAPLTEIKQSGNLKGNENIFHSIVVVENYPIKLHADHESVIHVESYSMIEETNYNLALSILNHGDLKLEFTYNSNLISDEMVARLALYYRNFLEAVSNTKDISIQDVNILSEKEIYQNLYEKNQTYADYPKDESIYELFEDQARKTPEQVAVVFENNTLTYRELNETANRLARTIREHGVGIGQVVGLLMDNSPNVVISMLAVLKAGGVYLPIDPAYPIERIEYMLQDSRTQLLLTDKDWEKQISFDGEIINLQHKNVYHHSAEQLDKITTHDDIAYVIYTSGSTGKPKGVMITHQGLVNYIWWAKKVYLQGEVLDFSLYSSISFDLTVTSIYTPLITGAKIVIYKGEEKVFLIDQIVKDNKTAVMKLTPTHLKLLDEMDLNESKLRKLIVGGENLKSDLAKRITEKFGGNIEIYNEYGPTETTVGCMIHQYNSSIDTRGSVPIGVPADNVQIYVLNHKLKPVPLGSVGELYISGDGVAKGYLSKPELTSEKFISNPFVPGTLMYKTGDCARFLEDGKIEYIGRIDQQVKVRGYRIELEEIECKLLLHDFIKEALVVVKEDNDKNPYLCAYLVSTKELFSAELRKHLAHQLPEYMIPSKFVQLEKMPLTQNGKIDNKALPEPEGDMNTGVGYEAARNEQEEKLVRIWREVLEIEQVGITDNFFDLGGHSLKVTKLVSKIHKQFQVELPLQEVFKSPTIKGISEYITKASEQRFEMIQPVKRRDFYGVSSAQKRMFLLHQMDIQGTGYNISGVMEIVGRPDINKIDLCFNQLIERHESLRTTFHSIDGQIVQRIHQKVAFKVDFVEHTDHLNKKTNEWLEEFVKPFDLSIGPLLRVKIIKANVDQYFLLVDMHHIISDGVSMGILIREFTDLYSGKTLEPLLLQYKDFSEWQNDLLRSEKMKNQEKYWLSKFSDEIPVLSLLTDFVRPSIQSFEGNTLYISLDKELTKMLGDIAKDTGSTMYMILLSALYILLSKYSGQEDIVIGSTIAGRQHADVDKIIGMFVNTLAMRNQPLGNKVYEEFLTEVKRNALLAYENQDYQFEELVEKLNIRRDMSRNPLFDVMFTMQNMDMPTIKLHDFTCKVCMQERSASKFDLTFYAYENPDKKEITIGLQYGTKLFKRSSMQRMLSNFQMILKGICQNRQVILADLDILTPEERHIILNNFNDTIVDYPHTKTISELFEEQVKKTPNHTAVVFENKHYTYQELNVRSNMFARMLREKGVKRDDIVGIMTEHSLETIVGLLGILKAGGAYLPIDPEYPEDRIEYILENSKAILLITQRVNSEKNFFFTKTLDVTDEKIYTNDGENLCLNCTSDSLAYVMYTSGSTGNPKGVMIENKSVVRLVKNTNYVPFQEGAKLLQTGTLSFDASTFEIWGALLNGLQLHLVRKYTILDPKKLEMYINENNINILWLTSSLFNIMAQEIPSMFKNVDYLLVGGATLSTKHINRVMQESKGVKIINGYGPTENTTFTTCFLIDKMYSVTIPIGKPINNTTVYIVDKHNNLQPIGVPGELCIAGDGLARGYINNPQLTDQKFIENPFVTGDRMYKTGDTARWLDDGTIDFIGRIDHQVKIRGFRIELGEVENQLLAHEAVSEAIVVDKIDSSGVTYLCSYIVLHEGVNIREIRDYLSANVPDYMIPSHFVKLDRMPLTQNGKIDRKILPEPDGSLMTGAEYEAPRNEVEEILVGIWSELLSVKSMGINDNFFELGGHSLKAAQLISKIHKHFRVEIPLKEFFQLPTIKGISQYIDKTAESGYEAIESVKESNYYGASSAQKRMYMLQQFEPYNTGYNMPVVLEMEGKLDVEKVENVCKRLINRHETLRTSFSTIDEQIVQIINKEVNFKIEMITNEKETDTEKDKIISKFVRPFSLHEAPLLRVSLLKIKEDKHLLLFDMHHIISDGVSMGILVKEFMQLYEGKHLGNLQIQYKDYTVWQNKLLHSEKVKRQEKYWTQTFSDEIPVLNMPIDFVRPSVQSFEGNVLHATLDKEVTQYLKNLATEEGCTLYMVLLSGISILLSKYSEQDDIIIGSPIAGRPHGDLQNIIGMFVNTLAMRSHPVGSKSYKAFLQEVKESALQAYDNQDYPFEALINKVNVRRDISRNPMFDVMFTMDNMDIEKVRMNDLLIKEYKIESKVAKFDLTFSAKEIDEGLELHVEYCTKLYKEETISRMLEHYKRILEVISKNRMILLKDIDMLTDLEKHTLVNEYNSTYSDYPRDKIIQEKFEEQVEKVPNEIAVVFEDNYLTYRELNEKANRLARTLREKGVERETLVGILVERSLEMMVALMAVLKSGGAYLPIDPDVPEERMNYIINDSQIKVLIMQNKFIGKVSCDGEVIDVDNEAAYAEDATNLNRINQSHDLAYVIYTSGSTGNPKGVMIEHRNVLHVCNWYNNLYNVQAHKNTLQITNLAFDVAVLETIVVILNRGTIFIPKKEIIFDKDQFREYVNRYQINSVQFVPQTLSQLVLGNEKMNSLTLLVSGGDILENTLKNTIISMGYNLFNHYGPTETTVDTITTSCSEKNVIGKPVENSQVYIMSQSGHLQPMGIPGEIYIGGDGVARGYLNRPELTDERFIDNPFIPGARIYKTGDLGRWSPDGDLEFLGRIDNQVKIRGIRIELGEIERQLIEHPFITEAYVLDKKNKHGEKYLCAYVKVVQEIPVEELRKRLLEKLPEYMVPASFVQLDKLPLTSNGKVDRKALPEPMEVLMSELELEAPTNEIQQRLASIWQEVLGVETVGINQNFFELGGQSLKASIITSRIHKAFEVVVPLVEIFKLPTIKELSMYIAQAEKRMYSMIPKAAEQEYYPLSRAQKRLFILHQLNKEDVSYNMPAIVTVEGTLDTNRLENALRTLVERHEVFRTTFAIVNGEPVQKVNKHGEFSLHTVYTDQSDIEAIVGELIQPFDLSQSPLLRVNYIQVEQGTQVLVIDMHHIISDGISMDIFIKELIELYGGHTLQALGIQYKDYCVWQHASLNSSYMKKLEKYWMKKTNNFNFTELPKKYDAEKEGSQGLTLEVYFDPNERTKIDQFCKVNSITTFAYFSAILNIILMNEVGKEDIVVGTPVVGRNHDQLQDVIGMFLNVILLRSHIDKNKTFKEYVQLVNETLIEALDHQEYPYEELYDLVTDKYGTNQGSLFSILLNYMPYQDTENENINLSLEGVTFTEYSTEKITPKYDVTFYVYENKEDITMNIVYKNTLYEAYMMERIRKSFLFISNAVLENHEVVIKEIDYSSTMDEEEEDEEMDMYFNNEDFIVKN